LGEPNESDAPLDVRVVETDSGPVVYVRGEIDMDTAPMVTEALEPLLSADCERIVIDLSEVSFIDSTGLTAVVVPYIDLRNDGRTLAVSNPSMSVQRTFEVAGVAAMLALSDDGASTQSSD
jgi:anti-sigma B factor antagonist